MLQDGSVGQVLMFLVKPCLLSLPSISDPETVLLGPVDEISAVVVPLLELRV